MADPLPTVLLVDDEEHSLSAMRMTLEDDFHCLTAGDAAEALAAMEENTVHVILCDQRMPGRTGVEFLTEVRARWPETVRIIITGYTETNDMIAAINDAGIYQFVTKPWHPDQLMMTAKNAGDLYRLNREYNQLSLEMRYFSRSVKAGLTERRKTLREGQGFEKVLRSTNSPMNSVIGQARHYAGFDVPVLIQGEPGTGKADLARAIHYASLRAERPFLEIDCAGIGDDILAAELFGARQGPSSGRQASKIGLLRKADRGTLFLNGLCTLSQEMQLALVRFVTHGAFRPAGMQEEQRSDVRLILGSHEDLNALAVAGGFRVDLYYAVSGIQLAVPPLRERPEDILVFAREFLFDAADAHGKPVQGLSEDAVRFLRDYSWPGNLRELKNEMVRMLIFSQDPVLGPELISRHILQAGGAEAPPDRAVDTVLASGGTLKDRVEEIEARILRETLTRLKWNKSRAAVELGLSRVGLRAKIDRYNIDEPSRAGAHTSKET